MKQKALTQKHVLEFTQLSLPWKWSLHQIVTELPVCRGQTFVSGENTTSAFVHMCSESLCLLFSFLWMLFPSMSTWLACTLFQRLLVALISKSFLKHPIEYNTFQLPNHWLTLCPLPALLLAIAVNTMGQNTFPCALLHFLSPPRKVSSSRVGLCDPLLASQLLRHGPCACSVNFPVLKEVEMALSISSSNRGKDPPRNRNVPLVPRRLLQGVWAQLESPHEGNLHPLGSVVWRLENFLEDAGL